MSDVSEGRAAVFTSEPQDVEVYQQGAWWPGSLLGWRHDDSGACQVWVRVVLGGVEETAWTDLATLRLPERRPAEARPPAARSRSAVGTGALPAPTAVAPALPTPAPAASPAACPVGPPTVVAHAVRSAGAPPPGASPSAASTRGRHATAGGPAGRPHRAVAVAAVAPVAAVDPVATQQLPLVRDDRSARGGTPPARTGGRRRAPECTGSEHGEAAPTGRRAAGHASLSGADRLAGLTAGLTAPSGRHRAPDAAAGRHRAADTGVLPAVPAAEEARPGADAASRRSSEPSARGTSAGPRGRASAERAAAGQGEPEWLTRPMRLGEALGASRRPRRELLSGV